MAPACPAPPTPHGLPRNSEVSARMANMAFRTQSDVAILHVGVSIP